MCQKRNWLNFFPRSRFSIQEIETDSGKGTSPFILSFERKQVLKFQGERVSEMKAHCGNSPLMCFVPCGFSGKVPRHFSFF